MRAATVVESQTSVRPSGPSQCSANPSSAGPGVCRQLAPACDGQFLIADIAILLGSEGEFDRGNVAQTGDGQLNERGVIGSGGVREIDIRTVRAVSVLFVVVV